jgi:hypothetical protein
MTAQRVAQLFGIVFLLIGILGFVPGATPNGMLLGVFPVNTLHNVVHLLFGVWGLMSARSFSGAVTYGKVGGIIYMFLAVLGFLSPNPMGLIPIGGADVWLHGVLGIALAFVGFTAKEPARV